MVSSGGEGGGGGRRRMRAPLGAGRQALALRSALSRAIGRRRTGSTWGLTARARPPGLAGLDALALANIAARLSPRDAVAFSSACRDTRQALRGPQPLSPLAIHRLGLRLLRAESQFPSHEAFEGSLSGRLLTASLAALERAGLKPLAVAAVLRLGHAWLAPAAVRRRLHFDTRAGAEGSLRLDEGPGTVWLLGKLRQCAGVRPGGTTAVLRLLAGARAALQLTGGGRSAAVGGALRVAVEGGLALLAERVWSAGRGDLQDSFWQDLGECLAWYQRLAAAPGQRAVLSSDVSATVECLLAAGHPVRALRVCLWAVEFDVKFPRCTLLPEVVRAIVAGGGDLPEEAREQIAAWVLADPVMRRDVALRSRALRYFGAWESVPKRGGATGQ